MYAAIDIPNNEAIDYINSLKMKEYSLNKNALNSSIEINAYYCPKFHENHFLILLSEFFGWTSILECIPSYSMKSNTYLSFLKNKDTVSITKFLSMDVEESKSLVQKGRAYVKSIKKTQNKVPYHLLCLNMEENWMGKAACHKENVDESSEHEPGIEQAETNQPIQSKIKDSKLIGECDKVMNMNQS